MGVSGAQPSRPASEGSERDTIISIVRAQPPPCAGAVYLYLFGPSHDVSAWLLPLRGRDLYSLCFYSANLLLLAALPEQTKSTSFGWGFRSMALAMANFVASLIVPCLRTPQPVLCAKPGSSIPHESVPLVLPLLWRGLFWPFQSPEQVSWPPGDWEGLLFLLCVCLYCLEANNGIVTFCVLTRGHMWEEGPFCCT